jgi:hypothetical protein
MAFPAVSLFMAVRISELSQAPLHPQHSPKGAQHLRDRGLCVCGSCVSGGAQERAQILSGVLEDLRAQGITSANAMAKALNSQGIATARGGQWTARSVLNVLQRLGD